MMNRLHIAGWGLLVGAAGQCGLLAPSVPRLPEWIVFTSLLPPWLTVYTISFCRKAPFGPRRFRHCLIFAIGWYAIMTFAAESLRFCLPPVRIGHCPAMFARALIYSGWISIVALVRTCILLRHYETSTSNFPAPFDVT